MWLVVLFEDTAVDLRRLGEVIGAGRVGFASPDRLDRYLGVIPGAVTPFAVVNDTDQEVRVTLERGLLECDLLHFHPLENTRTTAISPAGLLEFLDAVNHAPAVIDQSDLQASAVEFVQDGSEPLD
jgi:Ala-tRNA(Pro) deacylase